MTETPSSAPSSARPVSLARAFGARHGDRWDVERAAGFASPLGLFSEQVDTATGELVGNFPQAFSHLGLVTAAQALADAEDRSLS